MGRRIVLASTYAGLNPILERLSRALQARKICHQLALAKSLHEAGPGEGVADIEPLKKGDVIVVANQCCLHHFPGYENATKVAILHDVGVSKAFHVEGKAAVDYMTSPSAYIERDMREKGRNPKKDFWRVGYVQMDGLVEAERLAEPEYDVLFAPTWNESISGGLELFEPLVNSLRRHGLSVIVKLHPTTIGGDVVPWLCEQEKKQVAGDLLVPHSKDDLAPLMAKAKVMVSDCSSAIPMFMATGRPVVAYNSFKWWKREWFWDPDDWAYELRSVTYQFSHIDDCVDRVKNLLAGRDPLECARLDMTNRIWGTTLDGRVAERIAEKIRKELI